jgi:general secretion pathway protein J
MVVAVAVFAVVSAVVFTGLSATLTGSDHTGRAAERLADIQTALATVGRDLRQVAPRPIRNAFGETEPAVVWREGEIWITRGGLDPLYAQPPSPLRRVGYALDEAEGGLLRLSHATADLPIGAEPATQVLLTGVESLRFRFHTGEGWVDQWPPLQAGNDAPELPAAIAMRIELEDYGAIERSFRLP